MRAISLMPSGALAWAHVASAAQLTHYTVHPHRGSAATQAIGILLTYAGVSVHDGWVPYRVNTTCRHALCNEEQYQQGWASDLKALLLEMKAVVEQARAGRTQAVHS